MGKKKKEKKQVEEAQTPTPELRWDYGNELRDEASFGAILNYIAGTPDYTERDALWEFARKKRDGEFPWDGSGGDCKVPAGGTAGQVLTKATSENWNMIWSDAARGEQGPPGKSAYEVAQDGGFTGTEEEWLDSLIGPEGPQGPSGTITVGTTDTLDPQFNATVSNSGTNEAAIFNFGIPKGVKGDRGRAGIDGIDGKSAYEVAVDNGFVGTEEEWLDSIDGEPGGPGPKGDGWTGGVYHSNTGTVQFLSDDGLGFYTEDLRGATGERGQAATVDVGLTNAVAWDEDAEVTNVGTIYEAVFDFKIPKGKAGQDGTDGDDGRSLTWMGTLPGMTELNAVVNPEQGDMYTLVADGVHERNYQVYIRNNPPVADPGVWVWLGPWGNPGIPEGGDAGQILAKIDGENFNTQWIENTGGGPGGECATNYDELRDCAPSGGGGGGCYGSWDDLVGCTPSDGGGGGGCYDNYGDQKNCSPSDQDHLVLLDGAARPTKYVGAGRPDVDGSLLGTPVEGDTYICTDPSGAATTDSSKKNVGASQWMYSNGGWVCTVGNTGMHKLDFITWSDLEDRGSWVERSGSQVTIRFCYACTANPAGESNVPLIPEGFRPTGSKVGASWIFNSANSWTDEDFFGLSPTGTGNSKKNSTSNAYPVSNATRLYCLTYQTNNQWPTVEDPTTYAERIELAAKHNPELADELREELAALEAERNG